MRVAVIGAGVTGLCSAHFLHALGAEVIVIEREAPGTGCSYGNAGMIVPSHFVPLANPGNLRTGMRMMLNPESPFWIRPRADRRLIGWLMGFLRAANGAHVERCAPVLRAMNLDSRARYLELAREIAGFEVATRGLLMLCAEPSTLEEEAHLAEQAQALGLGARVLTGDALREADPAITMQAAGAVLFEDDAHFDPRAFMTALRTRLESCGVRFANATVRAIGQAQGRATALETDGERLEADAFVLAAGSWSPELGDSLGVRLNIQGGKGYSFDVENPPELPALCSILTESRVAVTPMGTRLRFAGTMEIAGLDRTVNPRRVQGIRRAIPRYFPAFEGQVPESPVWSGLRPCSADGLPYVGASPRVSNVIVAAGHGMMGMSLGPATGALVAAMVFGRPVADWASALRVDR